MVQLRWFYGGERTFLFIQLRCFDRVYLSGSAMVQLRRFLLREIGLSVQTTAMLLPRMRKHARQVRERRFERSYNCDGAMVLPREKERFCSYHCDGQLRCFYGGKKNVSVHTTAMANCDGFLEEANSISFDDIS